MALVGVGSPRPAWPARPRARRQSSTPSEATVRAPSMASTNFAKSGRPLASPSPAHCSSRGPALPHQDRPRLHIGGGRNVAAIREREHNNDPTAGATSAHVAGLCELAQRARPARSPQRVREPAGAQRSAVTEAHARLGPCARQRLRPRASQACESQARARLPAHARRRAREHEQ
eukprot:5643098-Alexandrium_andersonii.AAC.2